MIDNEYKMIKTIKVNNKHMVWYMFYQNFFVNIILIIIMLIIFLPEFIRTYFWFSSLFVLFIAIAGTFRYPLTDRKLYRLDFDEQNRILVCYYYFPFKRKLVIPYDSLSYEYAMRSFSFFGSKVSTLRFYKDKKLQLMLPKINRIGWTEEEIDTIEQELERVVKTRDESILS